LFPFTRKGRGHVWKKKKRKKRGSKSKEKRPRNEENGGEVERKELGEGNREGSVKENKKKKTEETKGLIGGKGQQRMETCVKTGKKSNKSYRHNQTLNNKTACDPLVRRVGKRTENKEGKLRGKHGSKDAQKRSANEKKKSLPKEPHENPHPTFQTVASHENKQLKETKKPPTSQKSTWERGKKGFSKQSSKTGCGKADWTKTRTKQGGWDWNSYIKPQKIWGGTGRQSTCKGRGAFRSSVTRFKRKRDRRSYLGGVCREESKNGGSKTKKKSLRVACKKDLRSRITGG